MKIILFQILKMFFIVLISVAVNNNNPKSQYIMFRYCLLCLQTQASLLLFLVFAIIFNDFTVQI